MDSQHAPKHGRSATSLHPTRSAPSSHLNGSKPCPYQRPRTKTKPRLRRVPCRVEVGFQREVNIEIEVVLAATDDVRLGKSWPPAVKLDAIGIKFKVVSVVDWSATQSSKENNEALSDEVLSCSPRANRSIHTTLCPRRRGRSAIARAQQAQRSRRCEEQGSTTTAALVPPREQHRSLRARAEALRMIDADKSRRQDQRNASASSGSLPVHCRQRLRSPDSHRLGLLHVSAASGAISATPQPLAITRVSPELLAELAIKPQRIVHGFFVIQCGISGKT